jgi:sugar (pentulose or hexulose) kinase
MNNKNLVMTIDFGTQSVRTMIFDNKGNTLSMEQEKYEEPYFSREPYWAEQDPYYYWEKMKKTTKRTAQKHPELLQNVVALGITTFRDSPILLDENYKPIRPMILWLDKREPKVLKKQPWWKDFLFWLSGMAATVYYNRLKTPSYWLEENEPENWKKTKYYVNLSTFINYLLTGELADSPGNQTGHMPINFRKHKWYREGALKNVFNVPRRMLCRLVNQGDVIGTISKEVAVETGIPEGLELIATGSDKGSETIGTGCINNNFASISYGTASSIEVTTKKYHEPQTFLPAYPSPIPKFYQMEVQIYRGYWMISWFLDEFGSSEKLEAEVLKLSAEEILNKKIEQIPPGSDGLILQPYWGQGLKRPEVRGAIVGFSETHTRLHIYRAIIEGIAFALKEALIGIEKKQHHKVKRIRVSGGGSRSDLICQITADIFNLPVERAQTYETASLGTAVAVFLAKGEFATLDDAVKEMVHIKDVFEPHKEHSETYDFLYKKVYTKLYPQLKVLYKRLRSVK